MEGLAARVEGSQSPGGGLPSAWSLGVHLGCQSPAVLGPLKPAPDTSPAGLCASRSQEQISTAALTPEVPLSPPATLTRSAPADPGPPIPFRGRKLPGCFFSSLEISFDANWPLRHASFDSPSDFGTVVPI